MNQSNLTMHTESFMYYIFPLPQLRQESGETQGGKFVLKKKNFGRYPLDLSNTSWDRTAAIKKLIGFYFW